jgi:hypothetical protein
MAIVMVVEFIILVSSELLVRVSCLERWKFENVRPRLVHEYSCNRDPTVAFEVPLRFARVLRDSTPTR